MLNITLSRQFWISGPNSAHQYWILHVWISLGTEFRLKLTISNFWTKFTPKKVFKVKNGKSEHLHWCLHIRISPATKLQLKLTILNFWVKFALKGYFQCKMERVNGTTESCIFELFYVPNFNLKWKFWFFGPNLSKESIAGLKQKMWKPTLNSPYLN